MALALPAKAGEAAGELQVWINPGIYSYHFDRDRDLRDRNFGFGVEVHTSPAYAWVAGRFMNSNSAHSTYAGLLWHPLEWQVAPGLRIAPALGVGIADGYPNFRNGGWFVTPLPLLAIEGKRIGVNLAIVPTLRNRIQGALAVQVKLRVR